MGRRCHAVKWVVFYVTRICGFASRKQRPGGQIRHSHGGSRRRRSREPSPAHRHPELQGRFHTEEVNGVSERDGMDLATAWNDYFQMSGNRSYDSSGCAAS